MYFSSLRIQLACIISLTVIFIKIFPVPEYCFASSAGQDVLLQAADGYAIHGTLYDKEQQPSAGNVHGGVVLLHMYKSDRESWEPLVEPLLGKRFTVLAIDMRGHGESRKSPSGKDDYQRVLRRDENFFNTMHLDAEAAVEYLLRAGVTPGKVALVGASVGCSVAIQTASLGKVPVAALVLMTPGKNYLGIQTMDHVALLQNIPVLILSSQEEAFKGAQDIYDVLRRHDATLKLYPQNDIHGTYMFGEVEGVETYIADWLAVKMDE